jgi:hypothetical protein
MLLPPLLPLLQSLLPVLLLKRILLPLSLLCG